VDWHELADLPFAPQLRPAGGDLAHDAVYDGLHFDQLTFAEPQAVNARFIECALTGVTVQGGRLDRARLSDVWLSDARLVTTSLAGTDWVDATISASLAAGVEAYGAQLRRVVLRGCKLDSVNFREAVLTDVRFEDCELLDCDFAGAQLTRTAFPGSRLARTDFSRARLDQADLRGAELGIIIDSGCLRGAVVSSAQLVSLAPLLAHAMGMTVKDD
jgi:uncharacterized protein YjbI with pentapeptide repeats